MKKTIIFVVLLAVMTASLYAQQYNSESDFQLDYDKDVLRWNVINRYMGVQNYNAPNSHIKINRLLSVLITIALITQLISKQPFHLQVSL